MNIKTTCLEVSAYLMVLLIGFSSGITGSGGSIFMIPVLVYFLNVKPLPATAYSLFIVGVTCLAGAGGGFLIIPVLVMRFRLLLKVAIGSSFVFIALNAVIGVLLSLREHSFNWQLLTRLSL